MHVAAPEIALPELVVPDVEDLVTEDDTPVDNWFSEKQQRLLVDPLYNSWTEPGPDHPFIAAANVGLFFSILEPPLIPDFLLGTDVRIPTDVWKKQHRSYFTWLFGKPPDLVLEIVSNLEGGEADRKLEAYARIGVPFYVIFDPQKLLSTETLRIYGRPRRKYQQMGLECLDDLGLGLQLWTGVFEDLDAEWLRWCDRHGQLLFTGGERADQERQRADQERQRADQERQRADQERQRADQLAERLRALGVEPPA